MFRSPRRTRQELPPEECLRILERNTSGVLATGGTDEYPYAVPLSYVHLAEGGQMGTIVFHCSQRGHKVEALRQNPRVSFCIIDRDDPVPIEFATHYASVIAFGTGSFIEDEGEKRRLLTALGAKYGPGLDVEAQEEIDRFLKATCVITLNIEHLTGKQAKALADGTGQ